MLDSLIHILKNYSILIDEPQILEKAFIHRSYLNEARDRKLESNERLEFLGDSVLSLVVSSYLYKEYPELPEGQLTNYRSAIVKTQSLATAARMLGLGEHMLMARGERDQGGQDNSSLLADTYEALLGVLYLHLGFDQARMFVEKTLLITLSDIIATGSYRDFKSSFQEIVQEKLKISPIYTVINSFGPDHAKTFEVDVKVEDKVYGVGLGKSKQEAEQAAAKAALDSWRGI